MKLIEEIFHSRHLIIASIFHRDFTIWVDGLNDVKLKARLIKFSETFRRKLQENRAIKNFTKAIKGTSNHRLELGDPFSIVNFLIVCPQIAYWLQNNIHRLNTVAALWDRDHSEAQVIKLRATEAFESFMTSKKMEPLLNELNEVIENSRTQAYYNLLDDVSTQFFTKIDPLLTKFVDSNIPEKSTRNRQLLVAFIKHMDGVFTKLSHNLVDIDCKNRDEIFNLAKLTYQKITLLHASMAQFSVDFPDTTEICKFLCRQSRMLVKNFPVRKSIYIKIKRAHSVTFFITQPDKDKTVKSRKRKRVPESTGLLKYHGNVAVFLTTIETSSLLKTKYQRAHSTGELKSNCVKT